MKSEDKKLRSFFQAEQMVIITTEITLLSEPWWDLQSASQTVKNNIL